MLVSLLSGFLNPVTLTVTQWLIVATLAEAISENILWFVRGQMTKQRLTPMITAIVVSLATQADIFHFAGITLALPVLGYILTGIVLARGANVLHDVINLVGKKVPTNPAG